MRYVISYDIEKDRIRTKLAKTLEGYGVRIQYSVFECNLTDKRFETLYKKILSITGDFAGSVRIYPLCKNCTGRIVTVGKPIHELKELQENTIII